MQLCRIINCSVTALHVSDNIFAHNQEDLNCQSWVETELSQFLLNLNTSRQRRTWIIPEACKHSCDAADDERKISLETCRAVKEQ